MGPLRFLQDDSYDFLFLITSYLVLLLLYYFIFLFVAVRNDGILQVGRFSKLQHCSLQLIPKHITIYRYTKVYKIPSDVVVVHDE